MSGERVIDYDQVASEYARHRRVHPEVLKDLLETGGVAGDSRVLEVGCGTGNYIIALEAATRCAGWGTEPSAEMLARARERSERVDFRPGRAEWIDSPPQSFDLVFSVDVIHHVGDVAAFFAQAYRVLEGGGRVCTVTDSEWIIRHRQPLSTYFPETVEMELGRYPGEAELRESMQQAGFGEIVEHQVEFSYLLSDIQVYRDKAFSALHLIPEEAFRRGIERMESDLQAGPIRCVPRYVLLWGRRPVQGEHVPR